MQPAAWSLSLSVSIFVAMAVAICVSGTRLTAIADRLADRSGIGEALVGGVLMGAVTSLSGSVLSVTAAWTGNPQLAVANAIGGMAAQLTFLAVADLCYRRANLEHAAASSENMLQGTVLICLLSVILISVYSPAWTVWKVHPGTPILVLAYVYGMRIVQRGRRFPMWKPTATRDTRPDVVQRDNLEMSLQRLWAEFAGLAAILALCGWILQFAAVNISTATGISQAVVGALFTAVTTSLPELVTSITAVRRGALTLAVGGIIGGNAYDSLFLAFSDVAYREGSIYHTIPDTMLFWIGVNCLMTAILLMGLLFRQRHGIGGIGFESVLLLVIYLGAVGLLVTY